jgi:hypothetical protein
MEHAKKVKAAALLVKWHSLEAPEVAREWSRALTEREDPEAAAVCLEIAGAATELLAKGAAREVQEPGLSDILSGAVTRKVMRADRVKQRDVEQLMAKAKRRRSGDDGKRDHPRGHHTPRSRRS